MAEDRYRAFARALVGALATEGFAVDPDARWRLRLDDGDGQAVLDLTPPALRPEPADAGSFFCGVRDRQDLLDAYAAARRARVFEEDLLYLARQVHDHARQYLRQIFERAHDALDDADAVRIARLVARLDLYAAVKSVESLLVGEADRALLREAETHGWTLHFDHLAIRAGTAVRRDAERVGELLRDFHGYMQPQVAAQRLYRFADGWTAIPHYKLLDNGELLRIFLDQSDGSQPAQIIRHWNRAYGFTAHHLAIRATRLEHGVRRAVPLAELIAVMAAAGIEAMAPTGLYTRGLLAQAFTRPQRSATLPADLVAELEPFDVAETVRNGKLLELISRREMAPGQAAFCCRLWGLSCDRRRLSLPVFGYFLPAQAAHVIRSSVAV